ncbi:hypothetical protein NX059_011964 [Plenodomus lindquistii]|nr:hypothetical protein NX059_011964 [Plenodomus lindquistii]
MSTPNNTPTSQFTHPTAGQIFYAHPRSNAVGTVATVTQNGQTAIHMFRPSTVEQGTRHREWAEEMMRDGGRGMGELAGKLVERVRGSGGEGGFVDGKGGE